ncbi:MAG: phosphoglycerate kinase [Patescibacteria group bacterium]
MPLRTIHDLNAKGKRILLRVDFNVPFDTEGEISDDTRIREALPTIQLLLQKGAKIILISHLGRPEGKVVEELRLDKVAKCLEMLMRKPIKKLNESIGEEVQKQVDQMQEGEIILLENIRFHAEEEKNDPRFIQQLAVLGDIFVNDGFGVSHRAHASSYGLGNIMSSYAGLLIEKEVNALTKLMENPEKPFTLIMGGAKIKDKLGILEKFIEKADFFLIGGGIANTFLSAKGIKVGNSLCEKDMADRAQEIEKKFEKNPEKFLLPVDATVAKEPGETVETQVVTIENVTDDMKIFDIGPQTIEKYCEIIRASKTIFWNGPMGLTEFTPFQNGTRDIATAIAQTACTSVIGGGDSSEIIKHLGFTDEQFSHISTGGGASLEFLSGKELPGLKVLYG